MAAKYSAIVMSRDVHAGRFPLKNASRSTSALSGDAASSLAFPAPVFTDRPPPPPPPPPPSAPGKLSSGECALETSSGAALRWTRRSNALTSEAQALRSAIAWGPTKRQDQMAMMCSTCTAHSTRKKAPVARSGFDADRPWFVPLPAVYA